MFQAARRWHRVEGFVVQLQLACADLGQQGGGDGMAHPGDDAFGAGDHCQLGDEPFDAHIRWGMRFEDLLEIAGEDAAGAVTTAQALGFASAVVAVQVGGDAGAVAADVSAGGRASGEQALGAAERALAVGAGCCGKAGAADRPLWPVRPNLGDQVVASAAFATAGAAGRHLQPAGVGVGADVDPAGVGGDVVDPVGSHLAQPLVGEVVRLYRAW